MIEKIQVHYYICRCDSCKRYFGKESIRPWDEDTKKELIEGLKLSGWKRKGANWFCPRSACQRKLKGMMNWRTFKKNCKERTGIDLCRCKIKKPYRYNDYCEKDDCPKRRLTNGRKNL